MSPEEINAIIAKALGWHDGGGRANWPYCGYPPDKDYPSEPDSLPDFRNDLNAMAMAEWALEEWTLIYVETLKRLTYNSTPHAISYDEYCAKDLEWCGDVFATAPQRCEAWLKAKGLWE